MPKVKDILSKNELDILKLTKTNDEIIAIAKARNKEHQDLQKTIQNKKPTTVKDALKDSLYTDDSIAGDVLRGVTTNGIRTMNAIDGVAKVAGFDLIPDKYTKAGNEALTEFEDIKQKTSRKNLDENRLEELKNLDAQSQNAKTPLENIKAGVNTMVDTVSHPSEWTGQGVVEMVTDPLNAVSFGAGSLAGKFGRTLLQKGVIGSGAGIGEGAIVNSGTEYIIAKGQNKSDEEAKKIALQSAGGGAIAGGAFGTFGGLVSKSSPIPLEKSVHSDILDNELLKLNDDKPLTDKQINTKLQEAFNNYPKVDKEFKKETAGVNKYSIHPQEKGKQDFQIMYDNLPVVRASKEIVPTKLKELVDVELIEPIQAQQIEQKINKMITHKDVIYANYDSWSNNISQDIVDSVNAKKVTDMKNTQDISSKAHEESKALTAQLVEQGADVNTIKDTINKQLVPTKEEKAMIQVVNDGMPVENRMSGFRLRDTIKNTFDIANGRTDELKSVLNRGGIVDEFSNVIIDSILNKDINIYDDYVVKKISDKSEVETKALKQIIQKDLKDANITDKTTTRKDIPIKRENGDNGSSEQGGDNTSSKSEQTRQDTSETNGSTIPKSTGRDANPNNNTNEVPDATQSVERHSTTSNNDGDNAKLGRDEVVSNETKSSNESITYKGIELVDNKAGEFISKDNQHRITFLPKDALLNHTKKDTYMYQSKTENNTWGNFIPIAAKEISQNKNYSLKNKPPIELTKGKRIEINNQVQEILKKNISTLTDDDKNILRQYTGTGGLGIGGYGSLTEHYTPYETIKAMYKAIDNIEGFKPKKALEPSTGSGNFVGFKPNMDWTTIDIDKTNYEVVKRLYPKAHNYNMSYESFKGKDFDLIISNVPFLEDRGKGITLGRTDIKALHDYYFVESLNKVKDNGVIAFITSTGVMDKVDSKIRKEIVSKADVIGAYRLPAKTFSKNAHTDVVTDIIFLQKRPEEIKTRLERENNAFIYSTKTDDDIGINQYYVENPTHILGDIKAGIDKMYGRPAYEITGKADYSNMKLDYKAYDTVKTSTGESATKPKKSIPTDSKEFDKWAIENDVINYNDEYPNFFVDNNGINILDKVVKFDDIEKTRKIYKILKGKTADKINHLENLNDTMDINLIEEYKNKFKTHPLKDNTLKKLFREANSMDRLYEYGALFDDKFNPADSFNTQTKYTDSGKLEITAKSKLHDRLLFNENTQGIININEAKHFDKSELVSALKLGYAYIDENTIANDILYYAGNIYNKLDNTQINLDKLPEGDIKNLVQIQHTKLQDTLPIRKTVNEIDFKGIEPWISEAGIKLFDYKTVSKEIKQPEGGVRKIHKIEAKGVGDTYNSFLNQDALIKAKDGESQSSYKRRLRDAQFEIKEVQARLKNEIMSDEKLRDRFEDAYNRKMNFYVKPDYSKAQYLIQDVLDELPPHIKLRKNQIEWVIKALYEGKNINAHDVGGGKTMAGIVLARVLKVKGIAKKPLLVVPSKVIKNWQNEILDLFPKSKIISLGALPKNVREKRLFELGNTNADYVLISHEGFKQLKLPDDIEQEYARKLINENMRNEDLTGRAREIQQQKIDLYLDSLSKTNANKKITIDKLGIDAVITDEARAFKNVGVNSKLVSNKLGKAFGLNLKTDKAGKFLGISLDSALAYDFRFKTKYISSLNNGKNIYLLDATPTPNKPIEVFTMLKHLDDGIFDEYGIRTDRDFAETFFEFGQKLSKSGKFENGIIAIKNAVALRSILDRYVDRIPMSEFAKRKLIKLPNENTIKEMISASDESIEAFADIRDRLKKAKEDYTKRHEVMGIFSNGVTASVDPRLYARAEFGDLIDPTPDNNKAQRVVELVAKKFKSDNKAGQIIFLDSAGHSVLPENLHQEIKTSLLKSGFNKNQVAIINGKTVTNLDGVEVLASGEKASKMKQDIVNAYKQGKIKVVIGTTKSAGEGMNIQTFTTDIYHIDLPWTPAEIIQRNGRGIRHGNKYDNVDIHYFFQEGTFDSLMYSTVMGKKGWNDAIWDADVKDRIEITDDSGSMPTEAEILIEMETNPLIKAQMIVRLEADKLESEHDNIRDELNYMKSKIIGAKENLSRNNELIKQAKESLTNDTPTEALKTSFTKAWKKSPKQKEYKATYEKELQDYRDRKKIYIKSREDKIPMLQESITKLQDGLKVYEDDFKSIDAQLKEFEAKHYDDNGNIITAFDKKDC
jgi:hypothetical protein